MACVPYLRSALPGPPHAVQLPDQQVHHVYTEQDPDPSVLVDVWIRFFYFDRICSRHPDLDPGPVFYLQNTLSKVLKE